MFDIFFDIYSLIYLNKIFDVCVISIYFDHIYKM